MEKGSETKQEASIRIKLKDMQLHKEDKGKCGVYCIRCKVDGKVYVGASINIYNRIRQHVDCLRVKSKNSNRHLIEAWHTYGEDNFEYEVLENLGNQRELLREREYHWMIELKSTDRNFGYNLRMDSSEKMVVHDETRALLSESLEGEKNPNYNHKWSDDMKERMSEIKKQQYKDGVVSVNMEGIRKGITIRNQHLIDNPEMLQNMKDILKDKNTKYRIFQYDKNTKELVRIWDFVADIIRENPTYKRHNIYAVCSGEKKSMYGYIWVKVLKDDIVQTDMKVPE